MSAENRTNPASGDLYGRYVGRWSRLIACDFLARLDLSARLAARALRGQAPGPDSWVRGSAAQRSVLYDALRTSPLFDLNDRIALSARAWATP